MKCLICGKEFKALTNTHLAKHGITPEEYTKKFGCSTVPEGWCSKELNGFYGKNHKEGISKVKSKEYRENAIKRRKNKKCEEFLVNISPEEYKRKRSERMLGEKNPMFGVPCSENKRKALSKAFKGRFIGENHPNWKGGTSKERHPPEFNTALKEKIRDRDERECFICGKEESGMRRRLDVHHIDFDKKNCCELNLVSLCNSCHTKVTNSKDWKEFSLLLSSLVKYKYGNQQPILEGNFFAGSETNLRSLTDNAEGSNENTSAPHPIGMMI
jgi:hypothetical protein